jgi:hypothetical protein
MTQKRTTKAERIRAIAGEIEIKSAEKQNALQGIREANAWLTRVDSELHNLHQQLELELK